MNIVGVDVGKSGGIAQLGHPSGQMIVFYDQPLTEGEWDEDLMLELVRRWAQDGAVAIVIEAVQAMPSSFRGAIAAQELSMAYGMWRTACASLFPKSKILRVYASSWKRKAGITVPVQRGASQTEKDAAYRQRKLLAVQLAREKFPGVPFETARGRLLDGPAEAALLADYGAQILGQELPLA